MVLDRLINVLEAIAMAGRPLTANEVHELTELPLPTCYRLLTMLKDQRLLDNSNDSKRYVIGERLVRIALLAKTDTDVCQITAPVLKKATHDFGEAVFLSRFREKGVSIIHVETPADPAVSYIHPGLGYRPMHACSCSKVIAAFADNTFRETILDGPMKAYTDQTHTTRAELQAEFAEIQKQGYAECVEEIEIGVSSVAAPVHLDHAGAVFSVGAIGPIRRFTQPHRKQLGKKLTLLASEVSSSIKISGAY